MPTLPKRLFVVRAGVASLLRPSQHAGNLYTVDDVAHALDVVVDVDGNDAITRNVDASLIMHAFAHLCWGTTTTGLGGARVLLALLGVTARVWRRRGGIPGLAVAADIAAGNAATNSGKEMRQKNPYDCLRRAEPR